MNSKNCNKSLNLCTIWKNTVYSYTPRRWPSSYTWWSMCLHCCSCEAVSWGSSPLLCTNNTGHSDCQDGWANRPPPPGPRSRISAWCDRVRHEPCRQTSHPESHQEDVPTPSEKNTVIKASFTPLLI